MKEKILKLILKTSKILCSVLILWNIEEKKNVKKGFIIRNSGSGRGFVVGRWGSGDDLTLLMDEGQVFRLIVSAVCPWHYWSWSCLLSASPWEDKGSDSLRMVFFPLFPFFSLFPPSSPPSSSRNKKKRKKKSSYRLLWLFFLSSQQYKWIAKH